MNIRKLLTAIVLASAAVTAPDCGAINLDDFITSFTGIDGVSSTDIGIDQLSYVIPGMETAHLHRLDKAQAGVMAGARELVGSVDAKYHISTVKGVGEESHIYGDATADPASLVIVSYIGSDHITVVKATGSPDMIELVKMDLNR